MQRSILTVVALATLSCGGAASLTYTGHIVDALDSSALAGVQVCITSPAGIPCVTTDAQGAYKIAGLPQSTKVTATLIKTDFYSVAAAFITRTADFSIDAVMLRTALVQAAFAQASVTLDPNKGAILVRAYDPALGLNSTVTGISGQIQPSAGDGPFYNTSSSVSTSATQTTSSGTYAIVNLPAGTYQVKSSGTGRSCPGTFHWKGSNGTDWIETPVQAGFVSYVYDDCAAQ